MILQGTSSWGVLWEVAHAGSMGLRFTAVAPQRRGARLGWAGGRDRARLAAPSPRQPGRRVGVGAAAQGTEGATEAEPRLHDVVGHRSQVALLRTAVSSGRVAQSYLFQGPSGVGKHLAARAFSAELRGARAGDPSSTLELTDGVVGIEQVRELGLFLGGSGLGPPRVAVIDAAGLSPVAASVLLRPLEERAGPSVAVLLAEDPSALPPAVASRCIRIAFPPLGSGDTLEVLERNGGTELLSLARGEGGGGGADGEEGALAGERGAVAAAVMEMAAGRPGLALEWWAAASSLPRGVPTALARVGDQDALSLLALARKVSADCTPEAQQWLLRWMAHRAAGPAAAAAAGGGAGEAARSLTVLDAAAAALGARVGAKIVWERALLELVHPS